jgi:hypothetical protein
MEFEFTSRIISIKLENTWENCWMDVTKRMTSSTQTWRQKTFPKTSH